MRSFSNSLTSSFLILCCLFGAGDELFAQKKLEVTRSYTMLLSRTKTMEATEAECIEQARLIAIAKEFGTTVTETTVNNTTDVNNKADNSFAVLTRTLVKGEWINDTEQPAIKWQCDGNNMSVTASVQGYIRELPKVGKAEVKFYTCSPGDPKRIKTEFKDGESLNAHFSSSQEGYFSVYYVDHTSQTALRIFPAAGGQHADNVPLKADKEYTLFNRRCAQEYNWGNITSELQLEIPAGKQVVMDEVVMVFSPEAYSKPMLKNTEIDNSLGELTSVAFEQWATELKSRQAQALVQRMSITISK